MSGCYTSMNIDSISSEDFFDHLVECGAKFAWFFHYMPVGDDAAVELLPTPEQREMMYDRIREYRNTKPIFTIDFQNDAKYVNGCIAGGRNYLHINANGDIEPCAFIHYSDSNIREKTLLEAYQSPLFMAYHDNQPFNENMFQPCPMLENPECLRSMVKSSGAHSTEYQSPESVDHLCDKTTSYAQNWKPKAEDVKSVTFGYSIYRGMSEELTEKSDIEAVLRLQELALEDRLEEGGSIPFLDGRQVTYEEADERRDEVTFRYASEIYIDYVMNSGKIIRRKYIVWGDEAEADIVNEYLSRWEVVSRASYYGEMAIETAASALGQVGDLYIQVSGSPARDCTMEELESLEAAIKADCEARTMTQRTAFHTGHFEYLAEYGEWVETRSIWLELVGENSKSGSFSVFADSENTLAWLKDHDLLSYEVHADNGYDG